MCDTKECTTQEAPAYTVPDSGAKLSSVVNITFEQYNDNANVYPGDLRYKPAFQLTRDEAKILRDSLNSLDLG